MYTYRARIVSIYDADTVRADIDLGFGAWLANQPLRIYGIDAPERGTPEGGLAKAAAERLLAIEPGQAITITTLKDKTEKYGRYLAKITLPNGEDYATLLIAEGYAVPYYGGPR